MRKDRGEEREESGDVYQVLIYQSGETYLNVRKGQRCVNLKVSVWTTRLHAVVNPVMIFDIRSHLLFLFFCDLSITELCVRMLSNHYT